MNFSLNSIHTYRGEQRFFFIESLLFLRYEKWIGIPAALSLMKGKDFIYEKNDTTFVPVKCVDVAFSISVKPKKWVINLDADFVGGVDYFTSRNWNHKYFIKND